MKKLGLFLLLLSAVYSVVYANVNALFNYSIFQSSNGKNYIEAYLSVKGNSLIMKKNNQNLYQAELAITYIITNPKEEVVAFEKFQIKSPEFKDSTSTADIIDVKRLSVPNGNYNFQLIINDVNSPVVDFETDFIFKVDIKEDQLQFSDIELIDQMNKTEIKNEFYKAGFEIIPNIAAFYDMNKTSLSFYVEIYHANKTIKDSLYLLEFLLWNTDQNKVALNMKGFSKLEANDFNAIIKSMDISKLPSGNYQLILRAKSKNNEQIAERSIAFTRSNPTVVYELDEIENSFVSQITNRDTLYTYINYLYPISSDLQKEFVANQLNDKDLKLMQQFFLNFWMEKNAADPQTEWLKYKEQVRIANAEFGYQTRPGYLTERGRVFLQYGPPTTISESLYEPSAYPYEIWQYDYLKGLGNRKFVFYSKEIGMADYVLIHSNVNGEVRDEQWKMLIYERNNLKGNSIDQTDPVNSYGNRADDYFNNPR